MLCSSLCSLVLTVGTLQCLIFGFSNYRDTHAHVQSGYLPVCFAWAAGRIRVWCQGSMCCFPPWLALLCWPSDKSTLSAVEGLVLRCVWRKQSRVGCLLYQTAANRNPHFLPESDCTSKSVGVLKYLSQFTSGSQNSQKPGSACLSSVPTNTRSLM